MNRIEILNDTLKTINQGYYIKNGRRKNLKLSIEEAMQARVFLPEEVEALKDYKLKEHIHVIGRCGHGCENTDSFTMARDNYKNYSFLFKNENEKILVLNFANPVNPGGGVRKGARAQEEDLCRTSSLLYSLESAAAAEYYRYNKKNNTYLGSDGVIISPNVEIIKDADGFLLDESVVVSVMTCAAPIYKYKSADMSDERYREIFLSRIMGMLRVAAYMGYRHLILGAFGCGVFGNDARVVSDLFYRALKGFELDGMREKDLFKRIDFAVLAPQNNLYNYKEFYRNFGGNNFYRDEIQACYDREEREKIRQRKYLNKIKGSMIGGAAGDALGYSVEFMSEREIFAKYGKHGITEYDLTDGTALISDDTQMSLFTANAVLVGETRLCMRGIGGNPAGYAPMSYLDWLKTQTVTFDEGAKEKQFNGAGGISWLLEVPELYVRRVPGNTCISTLTKLRDGKGKAINQSKGCGGVMRVAPLGLHYADIDIIQLDKTGAELAAITHGHSLGFIPAAVLTHVLNRIVYPKTAGMSLEQIVLEARDTVGEIYKNDRHISELIDIINKAVELSKNSLSDLENIKMLGEGWVGEEALAIAIYCSLRHQKDFSAGIIAAVNHSGDSDSTGAVTGNILGALVGYDNIDEKWKHNLELHDVISEMAEDLCYGCHMSGYSDYYDEAWVRKYMNMHWKDDAADEPETVGDIINSGRLDVINRILSNGGNL